MSAYITEPRAGARVQANWGQEIARAIKECRVIAGAGVTVDRGPNGQRVSARAVRPSGGITGRLAQSFDVSFSGSVADGFTATFRACYIRRGGFALKVGTGVDSILTYEMPAVETALWLGYQYNSETNAAEIISGAVFEDVSEQAVPAVNKHLTRQPLYLCQPSWSAALDLRSMPGVGEYN